ncbi:MAG TPA: 30S ribosomal protein S4e [Candidatus Diapherotrites archaeon]|uniref:Small ribosomal subunit protein eS4 n=1 Tax=Candidatus Iainarchaeum sp. TaxID=3101447 RepID=A0A7J4JJK2_9ARCH|nr:30S ribosomal protein S4e [Candidatus Diapherotrites archaeon]HIH16525.1 30S ribosomal protein S4e [Candidatus Diapherotrites archaeon]
MAKKGESKAQKALSVPVVRHFNRKETAWTTKTIPGPHNRSRSVPLVFALRNLLQVVDNEKEARLVLNNSEVKVNGVRRKELRFPVGLFDVLDVVQAKKKYRALLDNKGRLRFRELDGKEASFKLCKVLRKHTLPGGKQQLTLDDGTTLMDEKNAVRVGSTLKLELPARKIAGVLELKKGHVVYLIQGTHVGTVAEVKEVVEGTMSRPKLIGLQAGSEEFQTVERNVLVVGSKKPEVEIE